MNILIKLLLVLLINSLSLKVFAGNSLIKIDSKRVLQFIDYKPFTYYINLVSKPKVDIEFKTLNVVDYKHKQGFFCDFEDNISKNRKFKLDLGITGVQ